MKTWMGAILCVAALPTAAVAHLHNVTWETFPDESPIPNHTVITNQFNNWGALYDGYWEVQSDDGPDAISAPNTILLYNPQDPTVSPLVRMRFVFHGTEFPSIGNFIGITAIDSAAEGTIFTMNAYDGEDTLMASLSTEVEPTHQYNFAEDEELVLFMENMAYVTFSATAPAGQPIMVEIDTLRYNHIIPGPGAVGLLGAVGVWGARRRRRSGGSQRGWRCSSHASARRTR